MTKLCSPSPLPASPLPAWLKPAALFWMLSVSHWPLRLSRRIQASSLPSPAGTPVFTMAEDVCLSQPAFTLPCDRSPQQMGSAVASFLWVKVWSSGWTAPERKVVLSFHVSQENLIRYFFLLGDSYWLYLIVPICWPFLKIQHSDLTPLHPAQSEQLQGAWQKALCQRGWSQWALC